MEMVYRLTTIFIFILYLRRMSITGTTLSSHWSCTLTVTVEKSVHKAYFIFGLNHTLYASLIVSYRIDSKTL